MGVQIPPSAPDLKEARFSWPQVLCSRIVANEPRRGRTPGTQRNQAGADALFRTQPVCGYGSSAWSRQAVITPEPVRPGGHPASDATRRAQRETLRGKMREIGLERLGQAVNAGGLCHGQVKLGERHLPPLHQSDDVLELGRLPIGVDRATVRDPGCVLRVCSVVAASHYHGGVRSDRRPASASLVVTVVVAGPDRSVS